MPQIKDGFYDLARTHPSPNRGGRIVPRAIIVHDTAGALSDAGSIAWLCNPASKASAHFVISREGRVTQLISCNLKAWHAGVSKLYDITNVNDFSIGIELVNPGILQPSGDSSARASFGTVYNRKTYGIEALGTQFLHDENKSLTHPAGLWMPYPQAQLDALLALCLAIKSAYGIMDVRPHWYISQGRKVDTNPLFPLRWLQGKLEGRNTDPTAVAKRTAVAKPDLAENPAKLPTSLTTVQPVRLREWPSFNAGNVLTTIPVGAKLEVIRDAIYPIKGEEVPHELTHMEIHWYVVRWTWKDGDTMHSGLGWIPFTCVVPEF